MPLKEEVIIEVKGRDLVAGIPKITEVSSIEIRESLNAPIDTDDRSSESCAGKNSSGTFIRSCLTAEYS